MSKISNSANIQDTNEVLSLLCCVQRLITRGHQPFEHTVEHAFGHGTHRVRDLQFYKMYYSQIIFNNSSHCGVSF